MDLYDFLTQKPQKIIKESYVAVGEAGEDDFGIPSGDEGDMGFDDSEAGSMSGPNDYGDFGTDDGFGGTDVETNEGTIKNPLDDIEDSELSLTTETRNSFTTLYYDNKTKYEKLLSKNLDSSEFGPEFKEIQEQYKEILDNIRLYLKNKYDVEPIATKILQLNDFKMQLNTLHDASNSLLQKLGVKSDNNELW